MDVPHNQVIFPASLAELFLAWSRFPDAVPFAGGVSLIRAKTASALELPTNILSLERIDELRRITRTERYLELGAMVRLNEIAALGKIVPSALSKTLEGIANPQVRNLATIGGGICGLRKNGGGLDTAAPFSALDARYELRTVSQSRWVSAWRFSMLAASPLTEGDFSPIGPQELLTRIRVPLEQWDWTEYRKLENRAGEKGGVLICTAKMEKDVLGAIRTVFSGEPAVVLRDRNSETFLEGRKIPLERKDIFHYRELWEEYLFGLDLPDADPLNSSKSAGFFKEKLLNCIEASVLALAD